MRVMTQQWRDLVFLHWEYEPEVVRAAIARGLHQADLDPDCVELDTFDGRAYVGLIPFRMRNLRLPRGRRGDGHGSAPLARGRLHAHRGERRFPNRSFRR